MGKVRCRKSLDRFLIPWLKNYDDEIQDFVLKTLTEIVKEIDDPKKKGIIVTTMAREAGAPAAKYLTKLLDFDSATAEAASNTLRRLKVNEERNSGHKADEYLRKKIGPTIKYGEDA